MRKTPFVCLFALSSFFAARPAAAELGNKGDAIFGAERLFGVRGENFHADLPDPFNNVEVNDTTIAFGFAEALTPYNIPRLSFDYLITKKLSLGGSLGFSLSNVTTDGGGEGTPTLFAVAPRIGFLHMFGKVAGIWPRAGFTYHSRNLENVYKESGFALNLECMFPIVFAEHFGIELGLAYDQSITANRDPEDSPDYDISYRSIGLQVGLFGWI